MIMEVAALGDGHRVRERLNVKLLPTWGRERHNDLRQTGGGAPARWRGAVPRQQAVTAPLAAEPTLSAYLR